VFDLIFGFDRERRQSERRKRGFEHRGCNRNGDAVLSDLRFGGGSRR
jgi:hypothetical protein